MRIPAGLLNPTLRACKPSEGARLLCGFFYNKELIARGQGAIGRRLRRFCADWGLSRWTTMFVVFVRCAECEMNEGRILIFCDNDGCKRRDKKTNANSVVRDTQKSDKSSSFRATYLLLQSDYIKIVLSQGRQYIETKGTSIAPLQLSKTPAPDGDGTTLDYQRTSISRGNVQIILQLQIYIDKTPKIAVVSTRP